MALSRWKTGLFVSLACGFRFNPRVPAQELVWRHALSSIGEPKLPQGFSHYDYVNVTAPKGGTLKLSENGTFDSFNLVLAKGEQPASFADLRYADDVVGGRGHHLLRAAGGGRRLSGRHFASFRLRPEAKWADGQPVTPEDVIFSFDMAKQHDPPHVRLLQPCRCGGKDRRT